MITHKPLIDKVYSFIKNHRTIVISAVAAVFALSAFTVSGMKVTQDIEVMLPDSGERLTKHYNLLQKSPLTKKIIITVSNNNGHLNESVDELTENLKNVQINGTPVFKDIVKGPDGTNLTMLSETYLLLPNVITDEDYLYLQSLTDNETVDRLMRRNMAQLVSPAWFGYKTLIENDPLGLYVLFLKKLKSSSRLMNITVDGDMFKSDDGKYALIIANPADEASSFTNIAHAAAIVDGYEKAVKNLPEGTETFMVSPAGYTIANAYSIMRDMKIVIPVSSVLLVLLFIVFFRRKQALILLAVPVFAAIVSAAVVYIFYGKVSGIVIGFSSVLLGITVDYAIHTYLAIRDSVERGHGVLYGLREVSKPIIFSAATSVTAFGALFTSNIEGIRQFAFFGISGIVAGVMVSLLVIPLIFKDTAMVEPSVQKIPPPEINFIKAGIALTVLAVIAVLGAYNVKIDANFKNLGYVSDTIRQNEDKFAEIWGKIRDFAIIFATGTTEQEARGANERAAEYLYKNFTAEDIVSLSPILPSDETQLKNIHIWNDFWKQNSGGIFAGIEKSSAEYGFADGTFGRFHNNISKLNPAVFGLEKIKESGFANVTDFFIADGGKTYITLIYGDSDADKLNKLENTVDNVTFASFADFNKELSEIMKNDIVMFCSIALLNIIIILSVLFRRPAYIIAALVPVAAGLAGIFAVFVCFDIVIGLFHIVSLPLVIGLAADYGIFMTTARKGINTVSQRGVFLSGMTTIVGFGVLVLASHPSLHAIGVTVLTGIVASACAALCIIPATVKK